MVILSSDSFSLYMVMQTASLGVVSFSRQIFFILASMQVVLIILSLPLDLNPWGLTLGFNLVLLSPMVS